MGSLINRKMVQCQNALQSISPRLLLGSCPYANVLLPSRMLAPLLSECGLSSFENTQSSCMGMEVGSCPFHVC